MSAADGTGRLFAPRVAAVLVAVGVAAFAAMLLAGAFGPDLGGGDAGGHALSRSVNGFAGLVQLAEATGRSPLVVRDPHRLGGDGLLVATPPTGAADVGPVLNARERRPTLVVLPKWETLPDPAHRGWARIAGLRGGGDAGQTLAPAAPLRVVVRASGGRPLRTLAPALAGVAFAAPRPLQAIRPAPAGGKPGAWGGLRPLIVDERGNVVLGRFADRPLYVLADPDLLDDRGVHDRATAAAALALLDRLGAGDGLAFDVTLNGLARGASPLRVALTPPFLAATLALLAAAGLAALGTLHRFGSPRPRPRAIAFGKAALVDNTAALVARAGREAQLGGRYAGVVREAATRRLGLPARLRGAALDVRLDASGRGERFTRLAAAAADAPDRAALVAAARSLHDWLEERG